MNTNTIALQNPKLVVSVTDPSMVNKLKNAIKLLNGVSSISVMKEPKLTKTERQQAYVKETLTRALQEVKLARQEGRKLQSIDDFLKELDEGD